MQDPHVKERGTFIQRETPSYGTTTLLAPWIHMSGTPTEIHHVSPTIGQHTDEILEGILGLQPDEIATLRASKVVR